MATVGMRSLEWVEQHKPPDLPLNGAATSPRPDPDGEAAWNPPRPGEHSMPPVSERFLGLVDQIMRQHVWEMAELETRLSTMTTEDRLLPKSKAPDMPGGPTASVHTVLAGVDPSASKVSEHLLSLGLNPAIVNPVEAANSSGTMRWRKAKTANLRELQASDVLQAMDKEKDIQKLFETPLASAAVTEISTQDEESAFVEHWSPDLTWRQRLVFFLQSSRFEMLITTVLCVNVLWMALELQVYGSFTSYEVGVVFESPIPLDWKSDIDLVFKIGDAIFTGLFILDVLIRSTLLGRRFFKVCMNYVDILVTTASVVELIASEMTVNPMMFRLLRIGKLARALRMVTMSSVLSSLQLLIKCLSASAGMLFWSFCLLTFIQCVAGMVVSTLCSEFLKDASQPIALREQVYRYYGTFSRTFLTMFEILFANWSPPCRVLVENVSEWFSVFFLLYRCVLGFAVLNVVNAVFVQQTMKTASSDEELAFKQKEKDIAAYARKVRRLFQTMDDSHDGAISQEEFAKLVTSPQLKFWMSQLELEYHDLLSLFEFLDDGDGQITLQEFIEGASRLRGQAKALDIWRLEAKVEILFEELLRAEARNSQPELSSYVQKCFAESKYSHIKSNARSHHN